MEHQINEMHKHIEDQMATTPISTLRGTNEKSFSSKSVKIDFNVNYNQVKKSDISEMNLEENSNIQIKSSKLQKKKTIIGIGHSFGSDKTISEANFNALECC